MCWASIPVQLILKIFFACSKLFSSLACADDGAGLWLHSESVSLCLAGPENQSQQSPHREEVSAAWQPKEASLG